MASYILAGVGTIQLFDGAGNLILTSKTLTDSGISINVTGEDIRGGISAPLLGRYYHDSSFELNLVDALFSLEYLALNVGGNITVGGSAITQETVTVTTAGEITVAGNPQPFGNFGVIGYYAQPGQGGTQNWTKITFNGKKATIAGLTTGSTVCVKYVNAYSNMRQFVVPSAIIPAECYAILTAPLFNAGSGDVASSSQVGSVEIEIPRFQLSGAQEFSMTMGGAATSNLTGSALAVYDTSSCSDSGYFARIKEIHYTGSVYDTLQALASSPAEFELSKSDSAQLSIIGIYAGGATGAIPAADLTFTVNKGTTNVTVSDTGVISAGTTAGTATIEISVTEYPDKVCYASVTVS